MNPKWIIDDSTPETSPTINGGPCGTVPRDYSQSPVRIYGADSPNAIKLIPRIEWPERIKELKAKRARLQDVRDRGNFGKPIPFLRQGDPRGRYKNGAPCWGYCWAHGPAHAVMLVRASMNLPYKALSAFAVAATIKNGRNEGGWGALALEFIEKHGIPEQRLWPQLDDAVRPWSGELAENAAENKVVESWSDITSPVYDRDMTFDQTASVLLTVNPVNADYDHWGHAVCLLDLTEPNPSRDLMDPNRWGVTLLNSWEGWGENGVGELRGNKAIPNNATAPRVVAA